MAGQDSPDCPKILKQVQDDGAPDRYENKNRAFSSSVNRMESAWGLTYYILLSMPDLRPNRAFDARCFVLQ